MLIFFWGADAYRSREKVRELKTAYLGKNSGGTGLFEFDLDEAERRDTELQRFFGVVSASGLFASKKFVVVKNALAAPVATQEVLLEFLQARPALAEKQAPEIILFWESGPPKKNLKLFKYLEKTSALQQAFELLVGVKLEKWTLARLSQLDPGCQIERPALHQLLQETESDLFRLDAELRKLSSYRAGDMITVADVDVLVSQEKVNETVFAALDAVAGGDKSLALQLLLKQLAKGENPLGILALCAWQWRQLILVADFYERGVRVPAHIASAAKLKPFQVGKALRALQGFPLERLKQGFALLADLDSQAKSGQIDPTLALELFVVKAAIDNNKTLPKSA